MNVWKFTLPPPNEFGNVRIEAPRYAIPTSVAWDESGIHVYMAIDESMPQTPEYFDFVLVNTGRSVPFRLELSNFIGTVKTDNGIVWHVWYLP